MEGEKERMKAGSLGRSGFQSYLCLWQPVTMAGGFICSSCHFLSCHTAGQSWQCWAEGLWWHEVQTGTERGVTVPAPSSSQSDTLWDLHQEEMRLWLQPGHLATESSPRPGCMAVTACALSHVTKQAWLVAGAGDVRWPKTMKPIIRGCTDLAAVGLFAHARGTIISLGVASAVSPQVLLLRDYEPNDVSKK